MCIRDRVATRNMELVAAGKDIIFQPAMFGDAGNLLGGAGNTFSFVLLCLLLAHSKQLKAFGKATIIPSFCRISEPVLYGAPIAFNPISVSYTHLKCLKESRISRKVKRNV